MNNRKIEKMLKKTSTSFVPDSSLIHDLILSPNGEAAIQHKKGKWLFMLVASVLIIAMAVFTVYYWNSYNTAYAEVTIDLNPSVEITINRYEKVIKVDYLNEDARELLAETNLKHKNMDKAIEIFIDKAKGKGYYNNKNLMNFDVRLTDGNNADKLSEKYSNSSKNYLVEKDIQCEISLNHIDKKIRDNANQMQISPVKLQLIEEIMQRTDEYSYQELELMQVRELRKILNQLLIEARDFEFPVINSNSDIPNTFFTIPKNEESSSSDNKFPPENQENHENLEPKGMR